jgi:hypothetical protein
VQPVGGKLVKSGGNLVSYFCTPDGKLIHAVGGPVTAGTLLEEAQWAVNVVADMRKEKRRDKTDFVRKAHLVAARTTSSVLNSKNAWRGPGRIGQSNVHQLLAECAGMPMRQVESTLFRMLSGEEFESDRSAIMNAARTFSIAERKMRPVLLILTANNPMKSIVGSRNRATVNGHSLNNTRVGRVVKKFEVVFLPKNQLPAFTNLKELRGLEMLDSSLNNSWQYADTYLVVDPSGEILSQLDQSSAIELSRQLDSAWELWEKKIEEK